MSFESVKALLPFSFRRSIKRFFRIPVRIDPDWDILASIGPVKEAHVVFDVGAHRGYFIKCWRKWCPNARIHAFEPAEEAFDVLTELHGDDDTVLLNQVGLAAQPGELELQLTGSIPSCNSFLAPAKSTWAEVAYDPGEVRTLRVPVTTLDTYCTEKGVDAIRLMKIDVQGFELEVLRGGAAVALPRTDYILVESAVRPFYQGAPRFSDVFAYLTGQGFHLINMRAWHKGNHALMETDLLFRRDDLMPPNPKGSGIDKQYVTVS